VGDGPWLWNPGDAGAGKDITLNAKSPVFSVFSESPDVSSRYHKPKCAHSL